MTDLLDTNVLVYRFDPRSPDKQRIATELLRKHGGEDHEVPRLQRTDDERAGELQLLGLGASHVTLVGVEVRRCASCGEHEVVIPRIEQLHRALAMAVIEKRTRLTAAEIRFLRKYLGWSGADFAKHMGVTPESVSRWENEREQMTPVADRLVRLMVVTKAPVSDYSLDALVDLEDKPAPVRLRVVPKKGGWLAEVQEA